MLSPITSHKNLESFQENKVVKFPKLSTVVKIGFAAIVLTGGLLYYKTTHGLEKTAIQKLPVESSFLSKAIDIIFNNKIIILITISPFFTASVLSLDWLSSL